MTDRELLELAAKAVGIWVGDDEFADPIGRKYCDALGLWVHFEQLEDQGHWFNPLNNDGAALRLLVKLGMHLSVDLIEECTRVLDEYSSLILMHMHFHGGAESATRRAIVRAAAEIGKAMT